MKKFIRLWPAVARGNIALGIVVLVSGVAAGILVLINGIKLLKRKSEITF